MTTKLNQNKQQPILGDAYPQQYNSSSMTVTATEFQMSWGHQGMQGTFSFQLSTFQTLEQDQPNSVHDELYDELYDGLYDGLDDEFHLWPGKLWW